MQYIVCAGVGMSVCTCTVSTGIRVHVVLIDCTSLSLSIYRPPLPILSPSSPPLLFLSSPPLLSSQSVSEAERLAKMVERCLSLDSVAIAVQNTCLRGVLYLAEDPGSTVIPLIGATMGKYITAHLTDFPRSASFGPCCVTMAENHSPSCVP